MEILFFRHGRTHLNHEQRLQGISDPPLDLEGKNAVIESAKKIPKIYTKIYTSPLRRAQQTAYIIGDILDIPVCVDERLIERNLGSYEGLTRDEVISQAHKIGIDPFSATYRPPKGGESIADIMPRAKSFLADLHQRGESTVVIVHGAWMHAAAVASGSPYQPIDTAEFYTFSE